MSDRAQDYSIGPHPWYGPCDALAPGNNCAECMKIAQRIAAAETRATYAESSLARMRGALERIAEMDDAKFTARAPDIARDALAASPAPAQG